MQNRAFSVIELVVVIIIFGILALVASLKFGPYDAMKVDGAARKIASDIAYAQMMAMTKAYNLSIAIVIDFNPVSDRYHIYKDNFNISVNDPFTKEVFAVNFTTGTYQGVNIESAIFVGSDGTYDNLGFTPYRGQPQACMCTSFGVPPPCTRDDPGGYYNLKGLNSDGKIEISYRNKKRQIRVTRETGRVQVLICDDISQGGACPN